MTQPTGNWGLGCALFTLALVILAVIVIWLRPDIDGPDPAAQAAPADPGTAAAPAAGVPVVEPVLLSADEQAAWQVLVEHYPTSTAPNAVDPDGGDR